MTSDLENSPALNSFEQWIKLLEQRTEGILCLKDDESIAYANDAVCQYLGYKRAELLEKKLSDISEAAEGLLEKLKDAELILNFTNNLPKRNEPKLLKSRVTLERIQVGAEQYQLAFINPTGIIQENVAQAGDKVAVDHADLRIKTKDLPADCIIYFDKDLYYTHVEQSESWNANTRRLVGLNARNVISPAEFDSLYPKYKAALEGKKSFFETNGLEDGKCYQCTMAPTYNEAGEIAGGVIFTTEIQRIKDTEIALQEKVLQLEQSQRRYRNIARNIPNGIVLVFNKEFRLILAEGSALQYFVEKGENPEGKPIDKVFDEETCSVLKPQFQLSLMGGQKSFELRSREGHWFQCVSCALPESGEDKPYGMAVFLDINKLKKAEEELTNRINELKQSEKVYRTLAQNIPQGVLIIFNKELRFTFVEGKGLKDMGYEREQMLNRTLYEVFPRELIDSIENLYKAALEGHANTFEIKGIHSGRNYLVTIVPLVNHEGIIEEGMVFAFDVDKLKYVEKELEIKVRELEESHKIYSILAGSIPNASLLLFDKDLRFTVVEGKAAELAGFPKEKVEGRTLYEILAGQPENLEKYGAIFNKVFEGESVSIEAKSGITGRWFSISALPVIYENNEVKSAMIVLFDIQERKNAQEEIASRMQELASLNSRLRKEIEYRKAIEENLQAYTDELKMKNEELEQFAYVASHDLQEPLRMVSSFTQLLAKRFQDKLDKEANEFIGFAVDGAQRMQYLINDLLEYSRVGRRNNPTQLSLGNIVSETLQNLSRKIRETGTKVQYKNLPTVIADHTQMLQLFQNIISNAIKFRRKNVKPEISISAEEQEKSWLISISDNGIGFDMAHKDRIFSIFQRLHTRDKYEGTGIGLALCKKIVEHHGGEIWAESEEGKGTTFYFSLSRHMVYPQV